MATEKTLSQRIAKLLNQSENAATDAEAETFLVKAQELATTHSIDMARARHALKAKERTVPVQKTIHLGEARTHGLNTLVSLVSGIAAANDVKIDIARNSTYVVAYGFAEDIDVAEALYASLSVQMAEAAARYRKNGDWKKTWTETETYRVSTGRRVSGDYFWWAAPSGDINEREVTRATRWNTARLDFQEGFARRIRQRLAEARDTAQDTVHDTDGAPETAGDNLPISTALVLKEKREQVDEFHSVTSSARGTYRGARRGSSTAAMGAGREAADSANLSGTGSIGGARKALVS